MISNQKEIVLYLHCSSCLEDLPDDMAPQQWQDLEVGWTQEGLQVWCRRHDVNVIHINFEGNVHPANTTREAVPQGQP